jgi:hypothetical protein
MASLGRLPNRYFCRPRFQIADILAPLNDITALIVVHKSLTEATQGFQYTLWNDKLSSAAELASVKKAEPSAATDGGA